MSHHHHHHDHDHGGELSPRQKLAKLVEHWVGHNKDHADNYRKWADTAREEGLEDVAKILEEAAEMNVDLNGKLDRALKILGQA